MLLIIAIPIALLGIVLVFAGLIENPALAKFVAGVFLLDASTAIGAAWASRRGPSSGDGP